MISAILAVAVVLISLYFYLRKSRNKLSAEYWHKQGVPALNADEVYPKGKTLGIAEKFIMAYNHYKAKGCKHYVETMFGRTVYTPIDPEILKRILIKDFDTFRNRGMDFDEKNDPLSAHLFNIEDERWRNWRVKLTPTFTTGKMKMMFPTITKCAEPLIFIFADCATENKALDIKEIVGCFTTDVIGSCAFGLECNSLKDPDTAFRAYGRKYMSEVSRIDKQIPKWAYLLLPKSWRFRFSPRYHFLVENTKFFIDTITKTIDHREKNNIFRKDFVHMLIQIKNRGAVSDDNKLGTDEVANEKVTMKELAAQSFVFYIAGFETSSTLMTFMCYELSTHQDIQGRLRKEILEVIEKHGGLTYEAVQDMDYLEKTINETLRLHPPLPQLFRRCNRDYDVPGSDLVLKKDTDVRINICAIHRDPDYYPDPGNFNPENFNKDAVESRPAVAFIPFGDGPRNCIGLRFGKLQAKIGIITLVKDFRIKLNEKTEYPLKYHPYQYIAHVNGGLYLDLERLS